jgi:hypothetical protein
VDHVGIEHAIRRAELLGLGAQDELVEAVLATRLATDLTNGEFWRTAWVFLIVDSHAIEPAQVGPIIDFLHSMRHERVAGDTAGGVVMREPPQPDFLLRGRTPGSLLRLVEAWHRGLGVVTGGLSWMPSKQRPMVVEVLHEPSVPASSWVLTELTNSEQLRVEGAALRHCVASYAQRCWRGTSRIWSLRLNSDSKSRSVVTIEIDQRRHAIVQARGFRNRPASGRVFQLLQTWAAREDLRLEI